MTPTGNPIDQSGLGVVVFSRFSGCGAAWLARLLGVQEVPSSNLGSPTKFLKELQTSDFRRPPFGVQLESKEGVQSKGLLTLATYW